MFSAYPAPYTGKITRIMTVNNPGFGEVMVTGASAPKLEPGNEYTVTLQFSGTLMPNESTIQQILSTAYASQLVIVKVNRTLFSNRFAITFKPSAQLGLNSTVNNFITALRSKGYESTLTQIETGAVSTQPGGVKQAVTETVQDISSTAAGAATAALKPWIPYLLLGGALVVGYFWLSAGGMETVVRPKQPRGVGKGNYHSERT